MVTEHQVIAIIATQQSIVGEASVPTIAQLAETVTAIESTGLVDLVVVSGDNPELLTTAQQLDAVNHEFDCIGEGAAARADLVASLIDGVETFIDAETWVLLVDASTDNSQTAQLIAQAIQAVGSNPLTAAVHSNHPSNLMLFKAGAFTTAGSLPVVGSVELASIG
jgi:CMP-N-acetylneuraminic acid synthetase